MEKYITISQLASIVDLSVHQLRYFEEKRILLPAFIAKNGYRMYGINEIYKLIHIIFLRELDVSVQDIFYLREQDNRDSYVEILERKKNEIDEKINQLKSLHNNIDEVMKVIDNENDFEDNLMYEDIDQQKLKVLKRFLLNHNLNAKDIYELQRDYGKYDLMNLIELYDNKKYFLCVEDTEEIDLILDKGRYVYKIEFIQSNEDADKKVSAFFNLIKQRRIKVVGKLIIKNLYQSSIFDSNSVCIKMMLKIK